MEAIITTALILLFINSVKKIYEGFIAKSSKKKAEAYRDCRHFISLERKSGMF